MTDDKNIAMNGADVMLHCPREVVDLTLMILGDSLSIE